MASLHSCMNIVALGLCFMALSLMCIQAFIPCNGGECTVLNGGDDEEDYRRVLQTKTQYISYAVLAADSVPCSITGQSYYNCNASNPQANPYQPSCTAVTRCERDTN
ncbi:hypothetical protein SUGI_0203980 [Cryptomeria japonica]|nr:hypothetical protein SUGI_0203980 [Cryptomeria japonica]